MIRHRVPFSSIAFATVLGVGGGVYIYKPFFDSQMKNQGLGKNKEEVADTLNKPEASTNVPENQSPDIVPESSSSAVTTGTVPESPSSAVTTGTVSETPAQPVSKE